MKSAFSTFGRSSLGGKISKPGKIPISHALPGMLIYAQDLKLPGQETMQIFNLVPGFHGIVFTGWS